jgi:hypothetical protein
MTKQIVKFKLYLKQDNSKTCVYCIVGKTVSLHVFNETNEYYTSKG